MTASQGQITAFTALLQDPPDFVIQIDDYSWKVHGSVISKQSKFFETACTGEFKESQDNTIKLHDDCPWIVAIMVLWLYRSGSTLKVKELSIGQTDTCHITSMMQQGQLQSDFSKMRDAHYAREDWQLQALCYQVADKYQIDSLKDTTAREIKAILKDDHKLAGKIVLLLGQVVVSNDKSLCRMMMELAWRGPLGVPAMRAWWKNVCGSDQKMINMLRAFLYEKLDEGKTNNQTLMEAMKKAMTTLEEAKSRMTYHSNNQPAKDKIMEATQMLRDAHLKASSI